MLKCASTARDTRLASTTIIHDEEKGVWTAHVADLDLHL